MLRIPFSPRACARRPFRYTRFATPNIRWPSNAAYEKWRQRMENSLRDLRGLPRIHE